MRRDRDAVVGELLGAGPARHDGVDRGHDQQPGARGHDRPGEPQRARRFAPAAPDRRRSPPSPGSSGRLRCAMPGGPSRPPGCHPPMARAVLPPRSAPGPALSRARAAKRPAAARCQADQGLEPEPRPVARPGPRDGARRHRSDGVARRRSRPPRPPPPAACGARSRHQGGQPASRSPAFSLRSPPAGLRSACAAPASGRFRPFGCPAPLLGCWMHRAGQRRLRSAGQSRAPAAPGCPAAAHSAAGCTVPGSSNSLRQSPRPAFRAASSRAP